MQLTMVLVPGALLGVAGLCGHIYFAVTLAAAAAPAYNRAAVLATEIWTLFRTVVVYGTLDRELSRYIFMVTDRPHKIASAPV